MEDNNLTSTATPLEQQFKNQGIQMPVRNVPAPIVVDDKGDGTKTPGTDNPGDKGNPGAEGDAKTVVVPPVDVTDWKAKAEATAAELELAKQALAKKTETIVEKVITQEELLARQKEEDNEILKFVVTEKNKSAIDYEKFLNSQNVTSRDYVFEKYKLERKAENLTEEDLKSEFEEEYKLNSTNESVLARANKKLDLEARELKSQDFKDFHNIRDEYKVVKAIRAKAPVYKKLVEETKPEVKVSYTPEGFENPIEVVVDYTDILPEIQAELNTVPYFQEFTDEKVDTGKAINDFIVRTVKDKKSESIATALAAKAIEVLKAKIELGAINPIVAPQGSGADNKAVTHPNINKIFVEQGIIPSPPKTT